MNHLYCGDSLAVLRASIGDETVDLIYLDPPFNSNANYNALFRSPAGARLRESLRAKTDQRARHRSVRSKLGEK
jgi:site-specific DNA-methyltransferase (adenine-specific)